MTILKFIYSIIADSLRLTLSAQVFTIPLIFMTFRQISLVSPLTNLLVGWIIAPITVIGMAAAILGWIFLPLGYVFGWVSWVMLEYILIVIQLSAKLPFSSISY
jgi:competence protein ComEC